MQDSRELHSLSSGVIANKFVNVERAESVCHAILKSMQGKSGNSDHMFRKRDQVATLAASTYIAVERERIEIDSKQLFQCLVVAGKGTVDTKTLFT